MKTHSEVGWAYAVIYDQLHACGCGFLTGRLELVRQVLRDCPLYEGDSYQKYRDPMSEWLLCVMTDAELLEHGSLIGGSWITEKGTRFLTVLEDETSWARLTDAEGAEPVGYCEAPDCAECKS